MQRIIGIGGRKGSGKTTIAKELSSLGYQRVSFADFLKECCARLSGLSLESMYDVVQKEEVLDPPFVWTEDSCRALSEIAEIDLVFDGERAFRKRREIFQFIGTDVLRKHDPDIHLRKTKDRILSLEKCFIDDIRFENEKALIEQLGGVCVFLVRPANFDYSNHLSEISLDRRDFTHVLVNDRTERTLTTRFLRFVKSLEREPSVNRPDRETMAQLLANKTTSEIAAEWNCSRDKVVWWANAYLIPISRNTYEVDGDAFCELTPRAAYWAGVLSADGCVKKSGKSRGAMVVELTGLDFDLVDGFRKFVGSSKPLYERVQPNGKRKFGCVVNDPYVVEDMKLWDIVPRKSKYNVVPARIRNNDQLMSHWLVGLIDGDGSIFLTKNGEIRLNLLASRQVVDVLAGWLGIPHSVSHDVKSISNLSSMTFSGKHVVSLYETIYQGMGLARKWDKVETFISKVWHH